MYKIFIIHLLLSGFIFYSFSSYADRNDNYYTVKELKNDWQVYDKYYHKYIPSTMKNNILFNGGVYLSNRTDQEYFISFYSTRGLAVFADNKLVYKHPSGIVPSRVRLPILQLQKYTDEDPFLLIFHNNQSGILIDSVCIQVKLPPHVYRNQSHKSSISEIKVRFDSLGRKGFIISFLCFVCLLVLYKFAFMKGRTLINVGLDKNMELLLLDRSGGMSVLLVLINSVLFMMLFYLISKNHQIYFNAPFKSITNFLQNESRVSYPVYLILFFGMMQTLKIFYVKIINALTFSSGVSSLQNYLLLNYLFQAGLLLLPLILVMSLLPSTYLIEIAEIVPQIFFFILVIISLLTSYMIYSRSELRNIYLFSYICTAEIVPLAIAFRVLLG